MTAPRVSIYIAALLVSFHCKAEKMDIATTTIVIDKLQQALNALPNASTSRTDIMLRLADLYSERARLEDMIEVVENDKPSTKSSVAAKSKSASKLDRLKGIELYKEALPKVAQSQVSGLVLQLAQLYELQGELQKAQDVYSHVVKNKNQYDSETLSKSFAGLGESYFHHMKYNEAQAMFEKALINASSARKPYINYRLSWCQFHKDNLSRARELLTSALKSQEVQLDSSFREEASRDLATFISRGAVTESDIQALSALSPDNTRKDNMTYLAKELNRLGKKSSSVLVWSVIGQSEKSPQEKIENNVRMAELEYEAGRKDQAFKELKQALTLWKQNGCEVKDECTVMGESVRKLIINWTRSEQDAPTVTLFNIYCLYVSLFSDMDMSYRAALTASRIKEWDQAAQFYRKASVLAQDALKHGLPNNLEASLLGEIEVAEMTKNLQAREKAYDHYIEMNPKGQKIFEVMYQKAHVIYENGNFQDSALKFHAFVLSPDQVHEDLKNKSADLAIESLTLSKQEDQVPIWAAEFAQHLPGRHLEFQKLASQGALNQMAKVINDPKASNSTLQANLQKLDKLDLTHATPSQRVASYKSKLIISERLNNLTEVQKAADDLLKQKTLNSVDREFALSRKAWAAEMTLDFESAFTLTKKLKMKSLSTEDRLLKLAILAELAGKNSETFYVRYLSLSRDHEKTSVISAKLIRRSANPRAAFKRYWKYIRSNPELMASLSLEIFAKTRDYHFLAKVLQEPTIRSTEAGKTLARFQFLKNFSALESKLTEHKLSSTNDKMVQKSLKAHLILMRQLEALTQKALKTEDGVLQVITLEVLAMQNHRLASHIISLPAPKNLTRQQKNEYKNLLAIEARKYQLKASTLDASASGLWAQFSIAEGLIEDFKKSRGDMRRLYSDELKKIASVSPKDKRQAIIVALATQPGGIPVLNLEQAKNSVKSDPFSIQNIEKLKGLEERAGRETMVAYLDARILKLQSGRSE